MGRDLQVLQISYTNVSSPSHTIKHHLENETLPTFDKFTHKLS